MPLTFAGGTPEIAASALQISGHGKVLRDVNAAIEGGGIREQVSGTLAPTLSLRSASGTDVRFGAGAGVESQSSGHTGQEAAHS